MAKKLKITQIKSTIGALENQKRTTSALGLKKTNHTVIHNDSQSIRGMIYAIRHLVKVEEINGE